MKPPSLTIGVEEEYQIIDPETRELRSYITEILKEDSLVLGEVKPELHQSMVEVGTKVCHHPAEVKGELIRLRRLVMDLAAKQGLKVLAAGSHPFSSWLEQKITPLDRYIGVKEDLQELAQRLLIFGTHVHIGIEDREFLIDAMNVSRYLLPHVLLPVDQFALLDGATDRAEELPEYRLPRLSADRHPSVTPLLVGVRATGQHHGGDQLHPQCLQDLVGCAAELELSNPGVPHL